MIFRLPDGSILVLADQLLKVHLGHILILAECYQTGDFSDNGSDLLLTSLAFHHLFGQPWDEVLCVGDVMLLELRLSALEKFIRILALCDRHDTTVHSMLDDLLSVLEYCLDPGFIGVSYQDDSPCLQSKFPDLVVGQCGSEGCDGVGRADLVHSDHIRITFDQERHFRGRDFPVRLKHTEQLLAFLEDFCFGCIQVFGNVLLVSVLVLLFSDKPS